jgi:hypothetical protein
MSETINITSFRKKGRYFYVAVDKTEEIKLHPDICLDYSIQKDADFSLEEWEEILYKNNYRLEFLAKSREFPQKTKKDFLSASKKLFF